MKTMSFLAVMLFLSFQIAAQETSHLQQQIREIRTLLDHGQSYEARDLIQSAITIYKDKSRKRRNRSAWIELNMLKGKAEYDLAFYPEALSTLLEVDKMASKWLDKYHLLRHEIANLQAIVYYEMNFTRRARQICDSLALIYANRAPTLAMAYTYELLGTLYGLDLQYERAKQLYEKSLALRDSLTGGEGLPIIRSYMGMATYYLDIGSYQVCYDYLQKGLAKLENWPNKALEGRYHLILGNLYRGIGDVATAEQYFQQAQNLIEEVRPKYHPSLFMLKNAMASARADAKDYTGAINIYKETQARFNSSPAYKDTSFLIMLHANLCLNYYQAGDFVAAFAAMDTSLALLKTQEHKDFTTTAIYLKISTVLANMYYNEGKYDEAKKTYRSQIDKAEAIYGPESPFLITSLNNLGNTYDELGEFEAAIQCFTKALAIAGWRPDEADPFSIIIQPFESSYTIWNRAECYTKMAKIANYNEHIKNAYWGFMHYLDFLDYMRSGAREAESKLITAADNRIAYERALDYLLKQDPWPSNYLEQALSIMERSRSLVLFDGFRQQGQISFPGLGEVVNREESLKKNVQIKQSLLEQEQSSLFKSAQKIKQLTADCFIAKTALYNFLDSIKTYHRSYYELKYGIGKITIKEVQKKLSSTRGGMLIYFIEQAQLTSLLITADSAWIRTEQVPDSFEETISQFSNSIQSENQLSKYKESAIQLYDMLIKPWKLQRRLPERLTIVREGILNNVPFEALLMSEPEAPNAIKSFPFLIKEHTISYDFSATMDKAVDEKVHIHTPEDSTLALAPFYLDPIDKLQELYEQLEPGDTTSTRSGLSSLPFSGAEIYGIKKQTPTRALYGKSASKAAFLNSCSDYRQLHISSHAISHESPDSSFIVFSSSSNEADVFDSLYTSEIYGLSINADEVVLSGCETGVGGSLPGEGIASLARAFTYAGAKSVVFSLWKVDDQSTARILVRYQIDKAGMDKDRALASAKIAYINNAQSHRLAHPRYWAGIIISGDAERGK